jgi:hypothetical protein
MLKSTQPTVTEERNQKRLYVYTRFFRKTKTFTSSVYNPSYVLGSDSG